MATEGGVNNLLHTIVYTLRGDILWISYIMADTQFKELMGEGFILLTRGYGFIGGVYHPPFDTLKNGTSTNDIKLKLYR